MINPQNASATPQKSYVAPYLAADTTPIAIAANGQVTLAAGTYYFPIFVRNQKAVDINLAWAAAVAATITLEDTSYEAAEAPDGASTNWFPQNVLATVGAAAPLTTGTSNATTVLTTVAGGVAAGTLKHSLNNVTGRRLHVKMVVTVGGVVTCAAFAK